MLDHAVIDSFVMAANGDQMRLLGKLRRQILVQALARRRHQDSFGLRTSDFGFLAKRFHRSENRLRLHHHPLSSTECRVIHNIMFIRRPITQVGNVHLEDSLFLRAFHDALAQWRAANFRKQLDDVDLHGSGGSSEPSVTWREQSLLGDWGQSPLPYSTISRTAR